MLDKKLTGFVIKFPMGSPTTFILREPPPPGDEVLGNFSFYKRLIAWDSYEAHMTDKIRRKLVNAKVESVIVRGGCTRHIQAPDLVWKKPFKARIEELCNDWLANAKHQFTPAGNMKPLPRRLIVEWVLKSCEELSSETVSSSMKSCALGLAIDGSEDNLISCFKEGKKFEEGGPCLKNQMFLQQDKEIEKDPFKTLSLYLKRGSSIP